MFLGIVGLCAAEATQGVGALLLLALLAAPAGTAQRLTNRPYLAFILSPAIAVACVWGGIVISYMIANVPPSFGIVALAAGFYFVTLVLSTLPRRPLRAFGRFGTG